MPGRAGSLRPKRAIFITLLVLAASAATLPADAAAQSAQQAARARPVTCAAGQATITVGKRKRCATLPTSAGTGAPEASLLGALAKRNFGVVRIRGRRVRSIWKTGGGKLKRVRTRLLRAIPKVIAFLQTPAARASVRVPGDPGACGSLPPGGSSGSFDGFNMTVGNNGDVTMSASASSGYVVQVSIGGAIRCSDLDLPECPTADGRLEGTDGHRNSIGLRVTHNGDLVQSLRTTASSKQTMKGQVEDDAKLDRMSLQDVTNETTVFQVPQGTVRMKLSVLRTVELNMRSPNGAFTQSPVVRVGFAFSGQTQAQASAAARQAARTYEQSFPDLIGEERDNYRRREAIWQGANRCAKIVFDPAADSRDVAPADSGTVTPTIESNAGGTATKAKWTLSSPEHGTFTPMEAAVPSPPIQYRVTGPDKQKLKGTFRATSTAGVAEAPWSQKIVDRVRYYRVTNFDYRDQLSLDGVPPIGGCTPSTTQNNHTTLKASGQPYDGAIGPLDATGPHRGSLTARGDIGKTAHFSGCKLNDDATAWVSCSLTATGTIETATVVDVVLPAEGPAVVTWMPFAPAIGDVNAPPVISPCVPFSGQGDTLPDPIVQTVPREVFTSPGEQTIGIDVPADVPALSGGTVHSSAHYGLTFLRVNEDGSPYGG